MEMNRIKICIDLCCKNCNARIRVTYGLGKILNHTLKHMVQGKAWWSTAHLIEAENRFFRDSLSGRRGTDCLFYINTHLDADMLTIHESPWSLKKYCNGRNMLTVCGIPFSPRKQFRFSPLPHLTLLFGIS